MKLKKSSDFAVLKKDSTFDIFNFIWINNIQEKASWITVLEMKTLNFFTCQKCFGNGRFKLLLETSILMV